MRVTTAFNNILAVPGANVARVAFTPEGIVVGLRRRGRRLTCSCGWSTRATYDRSTRRWRHLDLGSTKLFLEAEIRRLRCQACGRVRTEAVPWARPGARHTRDLQDVVAYLATRTDKTTITTLLRVSWEAVAQIVCDVVADQVDSSRLEGVYRIGVDEVSYRHQRFLTVVANHDRDGSVIWVKEGRSAKVLEAFYDDLSEDGASGIEAVSLDMGSAYKAATDAKAPQAAQCVDPFHVIKGANAAIDRTRRWAWNQHRRSGSPSARWVKATRWALLKDPGDLKASQRAVLEELRVTRSVLYRAYQVKEALRDLYRLADPSLARGHLDRWLAWACRCRIPAMVRFSRTVRANKERILAAVELGLSNSRLEGLNSKVRLINHRGYGHSLPALVAMIYLCCGGVRVTLPTSR
ncbi:MAG TPA: ISL3 family transposase [Acidimicrobiales bacterium]|nr:ISL3 family transposase [Acidimicrobiales bacterium]